MAVKNGQRQSACSIGVGVWILELLWILDLGFGSFLWSLTLPSAIVRAHANAVFSRTYRTRRARHGRAQELVQKVLGARVVFSNGEKPPAFIIELPGGAWIEIYPGNYSVKEIKDNKLQGWRHLALRVESIDAAKRELESRGVNFTEVVKPAGGGGRVLFFPDAEGNLLHLVERPTNSPLVKRDA